MNHPDHLSNLSEGFHLPWTKVYDKIVTEYEKGDFIFMEKLLIIAEKPSAARHFSDALGGSSGTFEGDEYIIVNLFGHILKLEEPEKTAFPQYKTTVGGFTNLENLPWDYRWFDFDKKVPTGRDLNRVKSVISDIKGYLADGYVPVIASDIDAMGEGDLLVNEVLRYVGYKGKIYREYHVDETPAGFTKALREKKDVTARNDGLIAATTRSTLDFLTQQLSRAATMTIQTKGYVLPRPVYVGRLQSTIVAFVGDQIKALAEYKPSSVWESRYNLDDILTLTAPDLPQFATKESWQPGDLPLQAKVREVKATPGRTAPPKALSLTALGRLVSPKGISAKRTLELCQKMYDDAVLTYPRTEDNFITPEQFQESLETLDVVIRLMGMDPAVFTHRTPRKTHVKEGGSHGALRPGTNLPKDVAELDGKYGNGASLVYRVVTERFLMMFLEDTEWIRHDYETVGTEPVFKGSIRVITRKGVTDPDEETDDVKTTLPDLNHLAKLYAHEVKSTAPQKPTEAWIMGQLIKHEVGTASTQVQTVARMIGDDGRTPITPGKKPTDAVSLTPVGIVSWKVAKGISLGTPECTRQYEQMIREVVKDPDTKTAQDMCYKRFTQTLKADIEAIYQMSFNFDELGFKKTAEKAMGTWNGEQVKIPVSHAGHTFTKDELDVLFSGEQLTFDGFDFNKNPIKVSIRLAWKTYNGKKYVGFEDAAYFYGMFEGKEIKFKRTYMGHTFTDAECNSLLSGAVLEFEAVNKSGETQMLKGRLEKQKTSSGAAFYGVKAEFPLKEGYVSGIFKGQRVTFKGSWSDHVFTQDEVNRLLAGETITITYTSKRDGKPVPVSGKLMKQTYEGRQFYGFKADFPKKK